MRKYILLLFVSAVLLHSATYYLSNSGNNSNNGTSTSTPWRTISKLDSALTYSVISQNDSILFNRGDRFFGQISLVSGMPIGLFFSAYGTGEKPIIDGSVKSFIFPNDCSYLDGKYSINISDHPDNILNVYFETEELTLAREPEADESIDGFIGFNKIESVTKTDGVLKFNDATGYSGGQIVFKPNLWLYTVGNLTDSLGKTDIAETVDYALNYGYFVQNHINALDSDGEWYFNSSTNILYFKTSSVDTCNVYVSGCDSLPADGGCGFYISNQGSCNYTIENLDIRNTRECICITNSDYVTVQNCDFSNSLAGMDCYIADYCNIKSNNFRNLNTYGIFCQGESNAIGASGYSNNFRNIGLKLGYSKKLFYAPGSDVINLTGVRIRGNGNSASYNNLDNIGYCGIKFGENTYTNNTVSHNTIDSVGVTLSDCGAVYTWHSFGTGHSIDNNTITNCLGNLNGTPTYSSTNQTGDATGIYMDELSCNMSITDNSVSNSGAGIVLQNGRSNTVTGNTLENNREFELHVIHGGWIINGGTGNPDDDIYFTFPPDTTTDTYTINGDQFYWNNTTKTLQNDSSSGTYVYVIPGNNDISGNYIGTSSIANDNYYTFMFSTWQEVNDNTLTELTGDSLGISNNLQTGVDLDEVSVLFQSADVYYSTGGYNYVGFEDYGTEFDDSELLDVGELELSIRTGRKVE